MSPPFVTMRGIAKTFGAVRALRRVDFEVGHGEIVGLVGDNAAGKSTLMKILSGVYAADAGEILIEGTPTRIASPMDARAAGIEMVYQDFALVPELSVTQNIFLGREITRELLGLRFLNQPAMARQASELFGRLGLRVPPVDTPVRALSGGQRQAVAIGRAIAFDARLVVMDEPTRQPRRDRDRQGARDHRPAEGARRRRGPHLASARGRVDDRRPGRGHEAWPCGRCPRGGRHRGR